MRERRILRAMLYACLVLMFISIIFNVIDNYNLASGNKFFLDVNENKVKVLAVVPNAKWNSYMAVIEGMKDKERKIIDVYSAFPLPGEKWIMEMKGNYLDFKSIENEE